MRPLVLGTVTAWVGWPPVFAAMHGRCSSTYSRMIFRRSSEGGEVRKALQVALLDFPRNRSVVHLEHKISGLFLEEPEQVAFFRGEMDRLAAVALLPAESVDLVARIATEHERE